jgi:cytochrome c-type biogenesis protein CcmH
VRWCALILSLLVTGALHAVSTVETFDFPSDELRVRYQGLIDEIRCPKCQNTNLSGSDAPIAKDLRGTVYRLVVEEGRSDDDVRAFLVARYGDFVLYDPPFRPGTWLLWLAPVIALLLAGWTVLRLARRRASPLSEGERARARTLLGQSTLDGDTK